MLRTSRRLRSAEVREVIASGRPVRGGVFLSARSMPSKEPLRAAVVVSKSVAKTAVMRNKLRRATYRILANTPTGAYGRIIFFLRRVPPLPIHRALQSEIEGILNDVRSFGAKANKR